mmetsp:Transcript_7853/g.17253  ORF Transcript_7853/g.17253 Transcript_7853/m.17253 type:complete len:157 (+) Transcript_7853:272-742(+)
MPLGMTLFCAAGAAPGSENATECVDDLVEKLRGMAAGGACSDTAAALTPLRAEDLASVCGLAVRLGTEANCGAVAAMAPRLGATPPKADGASPCTVVTCHGVAPLTGSFTVGTRGRLLSGVGVLSLLIRCRGGSLEEASLPAADVDSMYCGHEKAL